MAEITITAANVIAQDGAVKRTVTAGETITAGQPVWRDTTASNKYKKSKADALGTALCDGIALNGASDNQPLEIIESGEVSYGAVLTAGQIYGVSDDNAGAVFPVADYASGDYPVVLGVAYSTSILRMCLRAAGVVKP